MLHSSSFSLLAQSAEWASYSLSVFEKKVCSSMAVQEPCSDHSCDQNCWFDPSPGQLSHSVSMAVSYTHLRAHETPEHLVCRLLLEKKKKKKIIIQNQRN
eukprot:TRINITY_DN110_c0_g1_i1.p1 TRINITY_DN110_c0_g1~~TRINITY_DN110_c0_g1_i1.p1  ORF type:complete len:100 (-),score=27.86 TRINITY_DN110_c0_g1_i1:78-377(-)